MSFPDSLSRLCSRPRWDSGLPTLAVHIRLTVETNRRLWYPAICARRFTDAAEERMPLVEDGELDSAIRVEKRRAAREAVAASGVVPDSVNVSRLIERLMDGYDKRLRPNYKGQPMLSIPSIVV